MQQMETTMPPTDDDNDLTPPTAIQIAQRSLVLSALVCRGFIELDADKPETPSVAIRIATWLTQLNLHGVIEPREATIINCPLGQLGRQSAIDATWKVEGLAVIAWALGRDDFPLHDEQVDPYAVTGSLDFLSDGAADLIRLPALRTASELHACRELLYAIHCRLRGYIREESRKDFTTWIEAVWLTTLHLDASHLIVDNDLAIAGKPITEVDMQSVQACEHIVRERHRASIWLVGEYPLYSELPVDT
jgi:hypothetical protein